MASNAFWETFWFLFLFFGMVLLKPGCPLAEKEGSGAAGTETTESIIYFQPRIVPGHYSKDKRSGEVSPVRDTFTLSSCPLKELDLLLTLRRFGRRELRKYNFSLKNHFHRIL